MALRLVRKSSETPNITNKDDTKMIRYAYGGYNGFVENYGSEIASVTPSANGIFKIGSGRIVLQGWEVDIDDSGWELVYDNITGTRYYSIYLEISIETETVSVKSSYNTGAYPEINVGDDLTEFPNGTARLLLWQVQANGKTVVQANKVVQKINYAKDAIADIETKIKETKNEIEKEITALKEQGKKTITFAWDSENGYLSDVSVDLEAGKTYIFSLGFVNQPVTQTYILHINSDKNISYSSTMPSNIGSATLNLGYAKNTKVLGVNSTNTVTFGQSYGGYYYKLLP